MAPIAPKKEPFKFGSASSRNERTGIAISVNVAHPSGRVKLGKRTYFIGCTLWGCFVSLAQRAQAQEIDISEVPTTLPAQVVGTIADPAIPESSGIVASRQHPGVFWTINDSGSDKARYLFAIDLSGKTLASFELNLPNVDWEDLAIDDQHNLYIADIGNNARKRQELVVHRLPEPDLNRKPDEKLRATGMWKIRFAGEPFDCESLAIWKGDGYLVDKHRNASAASIYRFSLVPTHPQVMRKITELSVRAPVTAVDVAPDGSELAILTVLGPMRYKIDGDIACAGRVEPSMVPFVQPDMEAVCFGPGGLVATTEGRHVLLFKDADFRPVPFGN